MTTEDIISKYAGGNVKVLQLQHMLEDYALFIQAKITKGQITTASAHSMIPPVKLFCEMNDIILNWRKIGNSYLMVMVTQQMKHIQENR